MTMMQARDARPPEPRPGSTLAGAIQDAKAGRIRIWSILGPGLLMAGAAVGVSHLVQSTRAGADYGYQLLIIVLVINVFKYPFFEYGHRYAIAAGENLLAGYKRMGSAFLYAFLALTVVTAIGSIAGVTFVTAGLSAHLFGAGLSATVWSAILMGICVAILVIGRYGWLDNGIKVIMAVLSVATLAAFVTALVHGPVAPPDYAGPSAWTRASTGFLVALMGWMPAPVEVSVWQSLWIEANNRRTGRRTTFSEAKLDFNTGYILTAVLAGLFLSLGALVMHGSGVQIQNSSAAFANQLVDIYRQTLGGWAGPIIAVAALTTMFSTTLTVIDGYPRSLAVGMERVLNLSPRTGQRLYLAWMLAGCLVALVIIDSFLNELTQLIDLVTTIAFLSGPVYAYLNFRLITSDHTPAEMRPGPALRALSWVGLVVGAGFSLFFLVYRFAPWLLP